MADNTFQVEITARIDQLEKALNKAEKDVEKAAQAAKKSSASFGDFADSLSVLNVNFGGLGINVGAMVGKVRGVSAAIKTATMATRGFSVALAATGIGAIVIALGALVGAFSSTQRGTDALRKVTLQFQYVMDAIIGLLQGKAVKAFDRLKKAFKDPTQAVKDLWEAIKENLLNRLQGVIDAVVAAGKAIGAAIRLDWSVATMEAKNFGEALLQVATGIDDLPNKIKDVATGLNNVRKEGMDAGSEIARLDKQILQYKLATTKELAKQELIYKEQQRLSHDTSLSAEAQLEAQLKAEAALSRMEQIEVGLLNLEIKREKATTNTSDTLDEQKVKIAEMEAGVLRVNAKFEGMGKRLDENKRRIERSGDALDNIDLDKFESIDLAPEETDPEKYVDIMDGYQKIADKINTATMAAEYFSSAIGNIVEEGFEVLFDSAKGFDDFANVLQRAFQRIIAQMAAAAAKAIALRAIMMAFPGLGAAGVVIPSFGQAFGQNMFGGGGGMGGFRLSAMDVFQAGQAGQTQTNR